FETKLLRSLCESQACADRRRGIKVAAMLRRRLADLLAADTVEDIAAGQPQVVHGAQPPQIALSLGHQALLILTPNHNTTPRLDSGDVDWSRVNRVKIFRIEVNDD